MQRTKTPLLVFTLLIIASMACYSDSPLWVFGVTEVPPSSTFLPTPDPIGYPARFTEDQEVLAPEPIGDREASFFFLTRFPEELLPGVLNSGGSCDYGASLDILYIGQRFQDYRGSVYIDDVALVTTDGTSEIFADFDSGLGNWSLSASLEGGKTLNPATNVNFDNLKRSVAEGEDPLDVSNATGVAKLDVDFGGNTRNAGALARLDSAADWSSYDSLTFRVFVPADSSPLTTYIVINPGGNELKSAKQVLASGEWATVTFKLSDLGDVSNISEIALYVDSTPASTYYLVTCSGTVGWTNENRLAGPVAFSRGESAQTKPIGARGEDLPVDPSRAQFGIHPGSEPPQAATLPPSSQCFVGEVVDVVDISAVQERGVQTIWYSIECPVSGGRGWVTENRLYGPLVLPAQNGIGIISPDFESIELTANPGAISDTNPSVGTCTANQTITTMGFNTITENEVVAPYYQIQCGDVIGWTSQAPLVEIPYLPGILTMVVGQETRTGTEAQTEETTEEGSDQENTDETEQSTSTTGTILATGFSDVPITSGPERPFEGNIVGECPSGSVVTLENVSGWAGSEGLVFYQVTCNEINGWVESVYLPNTVSYEPGGSIWFTKPSETARGVIEEGFTIASSSSRVAPPVGQCALFTEATVNRVSFEPKALRRLGFRLYYEVTCQSIDGIEITGWVEQDTVQEAVRTSEPKQLIGS